MERGRANRLDLPSSAKGKTLRAPLLILTVDVEEDMPDWKVKRVTTTQNIEALPAFTTRMSALGVRPTFLCDYPVVARPASADVLGNLAATTGCELGTHMHAWNTPPFDGDAERESAERNVAYYQSELAAPVFRDKLNTLHEAVTAVAGQTPTSYRAGRFGIDGRTLQEVVALGYRVDSSVIPLSEHRVDGGPDHRKAPQGPYFPSASDVTRRGDLPILEIPLSIGLTRRLPRFLQRAFVRMPRRTRLRGLLSRDYLGWVDYGWLYPARFDEETMCRVAATLVASEIPVLNVFLHSSELIPGASGRVHTDEDVQRVVRDCEALLTYCIGELGAQPATLSEAADVLVPVLRASSGRDLETA